ncbi:hypothetical protein QTI33_07835 [Variovorax sp. J22P271]|uniref:hypothetical protein n=1 Tax=Variovorax davisae TaxID=3053515 RepID=UPI002575E4A5|nr:hypothetical protein [Variovorax sp. J22P271]MDM0032051.1 hypothetical protein [Variovorax sp. J22P271]
MSLIRISLFSLASRVGLLLLTLILTSCSTTRTLQPTSAPGDGKALVYFIRKSYPPYVRELRLNVNGNLVATISNNDFVAVNVPVGRNTILLEVNDGKPFSFQMPIDRAEPKYVILTGDVKKVGQAMTGYREFTVYLNWILRANPVSRSEAESAVAEFGKRLE